MITNVFIKHQQLSLRVVGAWPKSPLLFVLYFSIAITFFYLVFQIWDIIEVHNNLELLMDNLVVTVGVFIGLCKIAVFRLNRRKLAELVNIILNDWHLESKLSQAMRENCTRFQLVAKFHIVLDNTMNLTYILRTLTSYIFDQVSDRKFFAPSKFPFDARQSPLYEAISIGQIIIASIHFNANAFVDGFLATLWSKSRKRTLLQNLITKENRKSEAFYFSHWALVLLCKINNTIHRNLPKYDLLGAFQEDVLHACSKVDLVKTEIKNYSKISQTHCDNNKATLMALRKLHQKHLEFIGFAKNTQDIFSFVAFFHISFITLLQVMSGFMFIEGLERGAESINLIHYATLTSSFLITAGYYCICGEYLKYQSETIFRELCNCSWFKFSEENRKTVKFMMSKAQKPVAVTMGKFSDLSLIFFTTIVKTSFSYLSLVRAVR